MKHIALYIFLLVSFISVILTVYDKIAAKKLPEYRTRESSLLIISALGGSVVMLATMHAIRHKTKHLKFTVGIPVILILQAIALFLLA